MAEHTPTSPPIDSDRPVIGSKYVLDKLLGEGGYSWVYLANHKQISGLRFVVKLLKPSHLGNDQVLRRFEQEATTLARLRSPRIVKIVDYGPTDAGIPYIVSEYIDGVTLGLTLRHHGKLSPWLTAHLGCQVLEAMRDAHDAGIVHRDIKPDNVLITAGETDGPPAAMVLDFGIAKVTEQASGDADRTVEGLACSPRYAAPEVLTREPSARSDLYALGLVLAELMTGRPVFRGSHNLILASEQLSSEKVPIPEEVLATPLGPVIRKACEKQQSKRFTDAREMLDHLTAVRDSFATDAAERARVELDLEALMSARDERPLSEAEQTALTENLHTFEQQFTGTGSMSANIDQIVAAQQSTRFMRMMMPVVVLLLAGTLGVLGFVIFKVQTSDNDGGNTTAATTSPQNTTSTQPTTAQDPTSTPEIAVNRAQESLASALSSATFNRISVSASVDGAVLVYDDEELGALPIDNLVTPRRRPLSFVVRADGYDDANISVVQTGHAILEAGLTESGSREEPTVIRRQSPQPRVQQPTPQPVQQQPPPRQNSNRLGDYVDNPFD